MEEQGRKEKDTREQLYKRKNGLLFNFHFLLPLFSYFIPFYVLLSIFISVRFLHSLLSFPSPPPSPFPLCLSLSLALWLQTVLNVGHPVWKLSPLSFSHPLPHRSFIPSFSASFSPLLWFVWALCRLLDSSHGWILLHWIWFRMQTESAESLGPAASVSWNQSVWYPWLW